MKLQHLIALGAIASLSSCRVMNLPETRTESGPYVQLKSGARYEGSNASRSQGAFVKDKIELGDTSFKSKDVAFYSTGTGTYANIGKRAFASQVAAGKINLFKYMYTSTTTNSNGSSSTHNHVLYYIQKEQNKPLLPLTYNNLKPLIQPRTPEYAMLDKYIKTRKVSRVLGYGGIGLMAGGTMLASGNSSGIGLAAVAAGTASIFSWAIVRAGNSTRLLNAVIISDKLKKGQQHHKRVR